MRSQLFIAYFVSRIADGARVLVFVRSLLRFLGVRTIIDAHRHKPNAFLLHLILTPLCVE